jgi:hypothetical protein
VSTIISARELGASEQEKEVSEKEEISPFLSPRSRPK